MDSRTRLFLEAPIAPTLLRLVAPQCAGDAGAGRRGPDRIYFVGKLGTDALAGMALVFPVVMLMQMASAGAMGGGIASAIARALGARHTDDADALVIHALVIAAVFALVFMVAVLGGGRWLYTCMGGTGNMAVPPMSRCWVRWSGGLTGVFLAQGVALVIYGLIDAWAIAGGAWFGRAGWPRSMAGLLRRLPQT